MRNKIEKYLMTTPLFFVYLWSVLVTFIMTFVIFYLMDNGISDGEMGLNRTFYISLIMGVVLGALPTAAINVMRIADEFWEVVEPIRKRANKCTTKEEWEKVRNDLQDFYNNHKRGKFSVVPLNEIAKTLKIKEPLMK